MNVIAGILLFHWKKLMNLAPYHLLKFSHVWYYKQRETVIINNKKIMIIFSYEKFTTEFAKVYCHVNF